MLFSLIYKCACAFFMQVKYPVVTTHSGMVMGVARTTSTNINYYAFTGIPYAEPPLGNLRFKPTKLKTPWNGIFNATKPGNACMHVTSSVNGNEDCLIVNVYTKKLYCSSNTLVPVLVYIHGGAFVSGDSANLGPDYLLDYDMVIVTIQYRLNVMGFLTTLDDAAPGNIGLKDQNLALRWVKRNIKQFGGNPNRVTISGTSAGSASVEYHVLSRLSRGFFNQAIMQSASSLDQWAFQRKPMYYLNNLATSFGFSTANHTLLIEQLQTVDAGILVQAAYNKTLVGEFSYLSAYPFVPTIEHEHDGAFLTSSAFYVLDNDDYTKVPFMVGFNTAEGTYGQSYVDENFVDIQAFDDYPANFVPESMNNVDNATAVGKIIKWHYFGADSARNAEKFIGFMSQQQFLRGLRKSLQFKRGDGSGYCYRLSHKGLKTTDYEGVGHGEDIQYIWSGISNATPNDLDKLTRRRLIALWGNFVCNGKPTPIQDPILNNIILPQISYKNISYIDVGDNLTLQINPYESDFYFWEFMFADFGKPPYTTY